MQPWMLALLLLSLILGACRYQPPLRQLPDAVPGIPLSAAAQPLERGEARLIVSLRNVLAPDCDETTIALVRDSEISVDVLRALRADELPSGLVDLSLLYPDQVRLNRCVEQRFDGSYNVAAFDALPGGSWLVVLFVVIPESYRYYTSGPYFFSGLPERCQVYSAVVQLAAGESERLGFFDFEQNMYFVPEDKGTCFANVTY